MASVSWWGGGGGGGGGGGRVKNWYFSLKDSQGGVSQRLKYKKKKKKQLSIQK